jgi:hypothetical protein
MWFPHWKHAVSLVERRSFQDVGAENGIYKYSCCVSILQKVAARLESKIKIELSLSVSSQSLFYYVGSGL